MKLTPRLQEVENLVPQCRIMADIGTDHAYLPLHLLEAYHMLSLVIYTRGLW